MEEWDSRYTKSAQIATRTISVNICVVKRSNVDAHIYISIYIYAKIIRHRNAFVTCKSVSYSPLQVL